MAKDFPDSTRAQEVSDYLLASRYHAKAWRLNSSSLHPNQRIE
jgi:hypothetical protein